MKVLYVLRDLHHGKGGANHVIKRNIKLINMISNDVDYFEIPLPSIKRRIQNILLWQSYGECKSLRKHFLDSLKHNKYDLVFFDGSYYGGFLKIAHKAGIKTACFYHNVEYIFYLDKYKLSGNYMDKIMSRYIRYNEKLSTKYADFVISINRRDSGVLKNIYGKSANGILPTSFSSFNNFADIPSPIQDDYLLFVGTKFYANVEAINFIISEIAPYIRHKIIIVGDVCEVLKNKTIPSNIILAGVVDSLDRYYVNALCVLAPIFSGSGLKTKSVEALRYGKTLIGSTESMEGIPICEYPEIGFLCNSPADYVRCINESTFSKHNKQSLAAFEKYFSHDAQLKNITEIFKSILL